MLISSSKTPRRAPAASAFYAPGGRTSSYGVGLKGSDGLLRARIHDARCVTVATPAALAPGFTL